ncbi:ECF transporter S component [Kitasatospora acidiphila]|nr:ECF transporter S component [Kitasatospora acidiphila]
MSQRPLPPLGPRSVAALALTSLLGLAAFTWPLIASAHSAVVAHAADAPWLFALLLPLLLAVLLAQLADSGLEPKAVALLGVLAAAGAALRPLGAGTAGLEPMFFLMVLAGRVLGPSSGFVLGAVTMAASALLTGGVGPWLPFQMLAMGWVCLGAGLLPGADRLRGRREVLLLAGYGAVAAVLYGTVMNLQGWPYIAGLSSSIAFVPGDPLSANLPRFAVYCLTTSLGPLGGAVGRRRATGARARGPPGGRDPLGAVQRLRAPEGTRATPGQPATGPRHDLREAAGRRPSAAVAGPDPRQDRQAPGIPGG